MKVRELVAIIDEARATKVSIETTVNGMRGTKEFQLLKARGDGRQAVQILLNAWELNEAKLNKLYETTIKGCIIEGE